MPGIRLTLQLAVLCAVGTSPVYAQSDEHESSEHESASGHDSANGAHKNVVFFCGGIRYQPVYEGTTVTYIVTEIEPGAETELEFEEYE